MIPTISPQDWIVGVNLSAADLIFRSELVEVNVGGHPGAARVVALPGDRIQIKAGQLFLNGSPVREEYTKRYLAGDGDFPLPSTAYPKEYQRLARDLAFGGSLTDDRPYLVPPGKYFMLNDNRSELSDSRTMGSFPRGYIIAKLTLAYQPDGLLPESPRVLH